MTRVDANEWVAVATHEAMVRVLAHAEKVGLANTEEFTFRAFFMAAAFELLDAPRFQTEWKKFDLLVQSGGAAALIEFKYYLRRRTHHLDGTPGPWKGGASAQNEAEFGACLAKLRRTAIDGIDERKLVLVYERDDPARPGRSFHASYGRLAPSTSVAHVQSIAVGRLEARVLTPTPSA